eukprot:4380653-Prymnesium_polylepis.1
MRARRASEHAVGSPTKVPATTTHIPLSYSATRTDVPLTSRRDARGRGHALLTTHHHPSLAHRSHTPPHRRYASRRTARTLRGQGGLSLPTTSPLPH